MSHELDNQRFRQREESDRQTEKFREQLRTGAFALVKPKPIPLCPVTGCTSEVESGFRLCPEHRPQYVWMHFCNWNECGFYFDLFQVPVLASTLKQKLCPMHEALVVNKLKSQIRMLKWEGEQKQPMAVMEAAD